MVIKKWRRLNSVISVVLVEYFAQFFKTFIEMTAVTVASKGIAMNVVFGMTFGAGFGQRDFFIRAYGLLVTGLAL